MLKIKDVATLTGLIQATKEMSLGTCAGIDGVDLKQFWINLQTTDLGNEIIESLTKGTYFPQPLFKVCIPKPNGTTRDIFIPTVQDRAIQRMVVEGLRTTTELRFLNQSFGFRPERNTQQAILTASQLVKEGFKVCVLIDLENFFGNIDRERLRKLLRDYDIDGGLRGLINQFIKAPITGGNEEQMQTGIPAGIPLAPLLANIYLHPLDRELNRMGIKFVRYADDITLFFKTEDDCQIFLNGFWGICEKKFRICINRQKTKVINQGQRPILGFELGDYGGIMPRPGMVDAVQRFLVGLLADPFPPLIEILRQVRGRVTSTLSYYKCIDDFEGFKNAFEEVQEGIRQRLLKYTKLEILSAAGVKLARLEDHEDHSEYDALLKILPPVNNIYDNR